MYSLSLPAVLICLLLRNLLFCPVLGKRQGTLGSSDKNGENGAAALIPMTKRHVGEKAVTDEKCHSPFPACTRTENHTTTTTVRNFMHLSLSSVQFFRKR